MWDGVGEIRGNKSDLNKNYASISTDLNYTTPSIKASTLCKDHTYAKLLLDLTFSQHGLSVGLGLLLLHFSLFLLLIYST